MSLKNPIKTLNPEVARKIAAGEVIDRPNAIIRELIDNSIDSGAKSITVEISQGGIEKIRIIDDGCGMTKEDLSICAHPHATSKISTESDLMNLSTMGFRGEALASIAAVSRLSIISSGYKMRASITEDHIIEPTAFTNGTIVQMEGLFENFPARRKFLKRPATEGLLCKNTFIEKAISRPDIAFRFISEGEIKIDLRADQSIKDRFIEANGYKEDKNLFFEISNSDCNTNPEWSFSLIIGEPAVYRSNKKDIYIYTNDRKIQEYSLTQAIEYGCQGFFPNGTFPVAALFTKVRPDLVDFNIHPAKKEARFYDISALHHGISSTIKSFFKNYTKLNFLEDKKTDEVRTINNPNYTTFFNEDSNPYQNHISYKNNETNSQSFNDYRTKYLSGNKFSSNTLKENSNKNLYSNTSENLNTNKNHFIENLVKEAINNEIKNNDNIYQNKITYIGKCLGTFILAEKNKCLYLIDQHAAHERILFDKIMDSQGGSQKLLIPYKIHTDSKSQDNQLEKLKDNLTKIGFTTTKIKESYWEISSIPERWNLTEYDLRNLIFVKQVEPEQIIRTIAAMTACRSAIKDGDYIDDKTAEELINKAFLLDDPHCPHGRPIYTVFSKEKLFELVKRT